jgi:tripartite-type tricarboxylate transporter receptor subunit TctC
MKPEIVARHVIAAALAIGIPAGSASAQRGDYPQRPIRFVLGFPAGGASDILARAIGQKLTERWGQQIVVDNRPGATGLIASEIAANAPADGYTVLLVSSSYANNVILKPKLPFDALKDLVSVTKVAIVPNIAVVPPGLPVKNLPDLIKLARSKPGALSYASGGAGTGTHLATELLKMMAHIDMVHVPYKGTPPALLDLAAGRIQLMLAGAPPTLPLVKAGKLRVIAVTGPKRSPTLPDVPTFAETLPGYEATTWYGFMVPARTPKKIIDALNAEIRRALEDAAVKKVLADAGFEPESSTPAQLDAFLRAEIEKWSKVVKAADIKVN